MSEQWYVARRFESAPGLQSVEIRADFGSYSNRLVCTATLADAQQIVADRAASIAQQAEISRLRAALEEIKTCVDHLYSDHTYKVARLPEALHPFSGPLSIIARMADQALIPIARGAQP